MFRRVAVASALMLAVSAGASAQSGTSGTSTAQNPSGTQTASGSAATSDVRPATTTFFGDTGLWFVPTAEVLAHGKWSVSGYRRGTNYIQGFTNVGDFAGTFAVGLGNRAEVFGSFLFDTRVERDLRPIFIADSEVGGIVDRYPRANSGWSGNNVGDLYVGAKVNLVTAGEQQAGGARGARHPQGADREGRQGDLDRQARFRGRLHHQLGTAQTGRAVGLSPVTSGAGSPTGSTSLGGAFRWGAGAGFPSRSPLARCSSS